MGLDDSRKMAKHEVHIRAVNTGAQVVAIVQTPNGRVAYDGDAAIDGVPGTAAPVALNFHESGRVFHRGVPANRQPDRYHRRDRRHLHGRGDADGDRQGADFGLTGL